MGGSHGAGMNSMGPANDRQLNAANQELLRAADAAQIDLNSRLALLQVSNPFIHFRWFFIIRPSLFLFISLESTTKNNKSEEERVEKEKDWMGSTSFRWDIGNGSFPSAGLIASLRVAKAKKSIGSKVIKIEKANESSDLVIRRQKRRPPTS